MSPDSSEPISVDYLIEVSDDGKHPDHSEPEVIILPPPAQATDTRPAPPHNPPKPPTT